MKQAIPINKNVFWIGVDDWATERFEDLWPLPQGISYNSYIILDDKVALVDSVKASSSADYLDNLQTVCPGSIDYLIINHIEPDHSGAIKSLRHRYPTMQIIGNKKTAQFLNHFYDIRKNIRIIDDGEELDLGQHKLKFHLTPMVHWPETMMTYETTEKILFSGDVFGSYGASNGKIFDDQIFDKFKYENEILRYYSNVIGRYSIMVQKALSKLAQVEINIIASTHGPVWRNEPQQIWSLYDKWSRHETESGVVIAYASMYGNTEKMVASLSKSLAEKNIPVVTYNVSKTHSSYIIRDIWRYKALVLATPTYNMKPFPLIDDLVRILENKMMDKRLLGIIGSYGWSGGGVKTLVEFADKTKWKLVEPVVEAHCAPKTNDLDQCAVLGENIAKSLTD